MVYIELYICLLVDNMCMEVQSCWCTYSSTYFLSKWVHTYVCYVYCVGAGLLAGLCFGLSASQKLNLDLSSLFQVDGIDLGGVKNQL